MVDVVRVGMRDAANDLEITGQVTPYQEVEIRSRSSGLVTSRRFKGGQAVAAGQVLFTIDPSAYQTEVVNARANLAQARAAAEQSQGDVARYRPLLPDKAISRQVYDQAVAVTAQNRALVDARRAALHQADLDLSYTAIRSPIAGEIDEPKVDVGSLVTAGTTSLGVVSTLDPTYVVFSLPEAQYVRYVRANPQATSQNANIPLTLILPDGGAYALPGRLDTVSRTIAATGTLTLRGIFRNPGRLLRPGLDVRVVLPVAPSAPALLVPQRAVGDLLGRKYVDVVDAGHKVEQRFVSLGRTVGEFQVIASGLRPGETIIVDGLQLAQPGEVVKTRMAPMPASGTGAGESP